MISTIWTTVPQSSRDDVLPLKPTIVMAVGVGIPLLLSFFLTSCPSTEQRSVHTIRNHANVSGLLIVAE